MVELAAILVLGTLLAGALWLNYKQQQVYAQAQIAALETMKSKSLAELAQYHAARTATAVNVEMLRDTFVREQKAAADPSYEQSIQPRARVKDVNGTEHDLADLDIL